MDPKEIEQQINSVMEEAEELIRGDVETAASDIALVQAKLTALMANAGQVYRKYEFNAMKWKEHCKNIQEHVRSLRKVIETLNTERMTR